MKIDSVVFGPVLTEKATKLTKDKVYMFVVNEKANKFQIKEILENLYKIKIEKISVSKRKGKERRVGRRLLPKRQANKKIAYVKVKEGKIDLFPQT